VSTPIPPMSGPYVYPERPYQSYPPLGQSYPPLDQGADLPPFQPAPPAPPKKSNAGKIAAVFVGACVIGLMAGTVGGAVGYVVARETMPAAAASSATTSTAALIPNAPSAEPGTISDIAARVQPAVVQLNVKGDQGQGTGSGFVISADGYVITNNHVAGVAGQSGTIEVAFSDGTTAPAKLVGANPGYDIAVVKVDKTGLPTVPLGSSAALKVGDSVIAVGSPLGLTGTVTTGIVSALDRPVTAGEAGSSETSFIDAIQTDAAINPGNSGGPLLNGNGEVIGVNSAIASTGAAGGGQPGSIGLGFAIPIDTAKRIANEIMTTGKSSTPLIGVSLDSTYTGEGAQVGEVTPGGGAEAAGLQTGDVIVAVNGVKIADATELIVKVRAKAPGDTLTLSVQRNGQTQDIPVKLGSKTD
jgi:putative serine protease PepD